MSSGDDRTGHDELALMVQELQAENARLRGLLGLDDRPGHGHEASWAPTLLTEPSVRSAIDATATEAEKLALLWSRFGARSDVFAIRWENTSTGKVGWSPATRGGWSRKRSAKEYLPLTDDVFIAHLRGEETVGIYPLLSGDACTLVACDFDKAPGPSTRSPISTPATRTVSPLHWNGRGRVAARTCGCSSTGRCGPLLGLGAVNGLLLVLRSVLAGGEQLEDRRGLLATRLGLQASPRTAHACRPSPNLERFSCRAPWWISWPDPESPRRASAPELPRVPCT